MFANLSRRFVAGVARGQPLGKPLQQRSIVAKAASFQNQGAVKALHDEIAARFGRMAQGSPANISTGQLVQMMFELGAADVKTQSVGQVMNTLMEHGFYRQTHPQKRDSYGSPEPPALGLSESKRWATMIFLQRLKREEFGLGMPGVEVAEALRHGRGRGGPDLREAATCSAVWCQCPPGAAGTMNCAIYPHEKKLRSCSP